MIPRLTLALAAFCSIVAAQKPHHAVPGIRGMDKNVQGLVLLGELGCAKCHDAGPFAKRILPRNAPDLSDVGARLSPFYIKEFLLDPQRVKPGTVMPHVLARVPDKERDVCAESLTRYLVSRTKKRFTTKAADPAAAQRGKELFHTIGCVACHRPRDAKGDEKPMPSSIPLGRLEKKYSIESLAAFLDDPLAVRASGRMPHFALTPRESLDLANYLLERARDGDVSLPKLENKHGEEELLTMGRILFTALDCVRCHPLGSLPISKEPRPALRDLDLAKDCRSPKFKGPRFQLDDDQRAAIRAALKDPDAELTAEQKIQQHLGAYNCVACHQRGKVGGIEEVRDDYFQSIGESLGPSSRIPPPLTGVGAKLQTKWLHDTLAYGQAIRPAMKTRMPGFGAANTGALAKLFDATDELPKVEFAPLPKNRKAANKIRDIGRELAGDKGMNCIACHQFAGRSASTMISVDLVETTAERLKREWFHHYMLDPPGFRKGTIMPAFFPGGVSTRKDIAEGDTKQQLAALWHYLAKGRNVRAPRGLKRPSMEIRVGDETVMLRRSVQNTGKRGISVGFPERVSYTFDAESIALNQIWWGRFIDASPVWSGQGSGQVRIMKRERAALPKGPAFASLPDREASWPIKSRRELGQEFRGYVLDAKRRPTFRYEVEGVTVLDAPRAIAREGKLPVLRRTFTFESDKATTLFFRAAVDRSIEAKGNTLRVGRFLELKVPAGSFVVRDAKIKEKPTKELLVEIAVRRGKTEIVLEYAKREKTK